MIQIAANGEQVQTVQIQVEADLLRVAIDPDESRGKERNDRATGQKGFKFSEKGYSD